MGGTFDESNDSASDAEVDRLALASDWYAVGADLYRAIARYKARVGRQAPHGKPTGSR